ncbi:MAG: hemerythrin domain-containing protein [Deltaproteobacteria bacterium]|nr:hemerythrin domain-containing protein [Deltaproteobacteria bacterium]
MNDLDRFRRQHEELAQKMTEIERTSLALPNALVAGKCARLLAKMSGLLQVHLVMEEAFFYARADRFDNPAVRAICKRFQGEIDMFRPSFKAFVEQYSVASAIEKNVAQFQGDLLRHFDWLRRRDGREERELYQSVETATKKRPTSSLLAV